jgi:hypothetical protein
MRAKRDTKVCAMGQHPLCVRSEPVDIQDQRGRLHIVKIQVDRMISNMRDWFVASS